MKTITLSHEDASNLIEDKGVTEGASGVWRWGNTQQYIFKRDETYYAFVLRFHVEEGLQNEGSVTAKEVIPVTHTEILWKSVP